jgi:hypothetical protein
MDSTLRTTASVKICGETAAAKKEVAVSDRGYNYSCSFVPATP